MKKQYLEPAISVDSALMANIIFAESVESGTTVGFENISDGGEFNF